MTAIAEFHFRGLGASSSCKQLMAQTDAEDRGSCFAQSDFQVFDSRFDHCWISRTVREKEAICVLPQQSRKVVIPRYHLDFNTARDKAAELIVFQTNINADDSYGSTGGMAQSLGGFGQVYLGFSN